MGFSRHDPQCAQSERAAGDTTTGVLLTGTHRIRGHRRTRGGRHSLPGQGAGAGWRVAGVLVLVPAAAVAAALVAVVPGGDAPSAGAERPAVTPGTTWAPGRPGHEPALRAPESDTTPSPAGSDQPGPAGPRAATVGASPVPSGRDADPCRASHCVPWSLPGPSSTSATPNGGCSSSPAPGAPGAASATGQPSTSPSASPPASLSTSATGGEP